MSGTDATEMPRWPGDVGIDVVGGAPAAPDLDRLVRSVARQLGTDDRQVVGTVAWKRYSFSVASPVMAALGRHLIVPDVSLANAVVTVRDDEPLVTLAVVAALAAPVADVADADGLAIALRPLREEHLHLVAAELRARCRLPRRSLDVMEHATLVSALGSAANVADPFAKAAHVQEAIDPGRRRLVEIAELSRGDHRRPMALRSACCLIYKARGEEFCATCNLISDEERTEQLAARGMGWRRLARHEARHEPIG